MDGRRARGRRRAGGQSEPGRAGLLLGVYDDLRTDLTRAVDRAGPWSSSGREPPLVGDPLGRFHARAPRCADTVEHGVGSEVI